MAPPSITSGLKVPGHKSIMAALYIYIKESLGKQLMSTGPPEGHFPWRESLVEIISLHRNIGNFQENGK
jgi:hypothetical protein